MLVQPARDGKLTRMQSKAISVEAYLSELPEDRRAALTAVRRAILKGLGTGYQETMAYGMIGYSIPHSIYAEGYHCDPRQPVPMAGLGNQKQHMSLHLMGLDVGAESAPTAALVAWFTKAWADSGRKLNVGKACVRFKRIEEVPLEVVTEFFRRLPLKAYLATYLAVLASGKQGKPAAKNLARKPAKKPAPQPMAKKAPAKSLIKKTAEGSDAKKPAASRGSSKKATAENAAAMRVSKRA